MNDKVAEAEGGRGVTKDKPFLRVSDMNRSQKYRVPD
jgi:hypothetical protein